MPTRSLRLLRFCPSENDFTALYFNFFLNRSSPRITARSKAFAQAAKQNPPEADARPWFSGQQAEPGKVPTIRHSRNVLKRTTGVRISKNKK
eukprot:m.106363 g.106363  ORF g.106363 m.106363 type:complete len:92 (+) comp51675_c0_seq12:1594-1869(+)